jgi:hypothetical protein
MNNDPSTPLSDRSVSSTDTESTRPAQLQLCVKRFATVRSAERAMSVSALALQDDQCVERAGHTRQLLEDFISRCDGDTAFPESEWHAALAEIDRVVDQHTEFVLECLDAVTIAQLRSTMPAHTASHRNEVLSLVQLVLEDGPKVADRLPALEYLLTLLSTIDEGGRRKIAFDPVSLSPAIQSFCDQRAAEYEGDATEIELQIHQGAADLDPSIDPGPAAREMRDTKTGLGTMCLVPGLLRAIISYNTRMANVMAERSETARATDADFHDITDASVELHDLIEEATAAQPGTAPDFADASLKAEAPPSSVYDHEGLPVLIDALRRRLNGTPIGTCTSERVVLALDISGLEDYEIATVQLEERTHEERLLAYTVITGLLFQTLPTLGEALDEIGIKADVVAQQWINEINEDLQNSIKAHLQGGDYEAGCQLSESKTRLLYAPLSAIAQESKAKRAQAASQLDRDSSLLEAVAAAASADARSASGARGAAFKMGETISGWPVWRQNIIKLAAGAAMAALIMNLISASPDHALQTLETHDLSNASPYLSSAYRDRHGTGKMVIGRLDSDWTILEGDDQYTAAQDLVAALVDDGVTQLMIYDGKKRLAVHFAGGQMRRPVDPAVLAARPTARDVEKTARNAREVARRATIAAARSEASKD